MTGLLGITIKEKRLTISPNLPSGWEGYTARWELEYGNLLIEVKRGKREGFFLDGKRVTDVPLFDLRGEHIAEVIIAFEK